MIGKVVRSLSLGMLSLSLWGSLARTTFSQTEIRPDDTLAEESSTIRNQDNATLIEGGATREINLFHSFEEFNIDEGKAAYFSIPDTAIENIFSRITGSDPSDISGTLGTCISGNCPSVKPSATLYFMNPNGIFFGPEASLDVGGSFVATTANAVEFEEGGAYGAARDEIVSDLLTVNPSAFLFNQPVAQPLYSIESRANLSLPENHSLLFVGGRLDPSETSTGDIVIREGRLRSPGGQIGIGGLAASGRVGLSRENNKLSLAFPEDVIRSNFRMTGEVNGFAELDVTSGNGGSISVHGRNIDILGGSDVCAGIGSANACGSVSTNFGNADSQGGDILLNALGTIRISDPVSVVVNNVYPDAVGNSGDIVIKAESLNLINGGQLIADTSGRGNSGKIIIDVTDRVLLQEGDSDVFLFNEVNRNATGNSGGIEIMAGSLEILQGAQILSRVIGQGDSGGITIRAKETVLLSNSNIITEVTEGSGNGRGGDIQISAGSLELREGSSFLADTENIGDAGSIVISVRDAVLLQGQGPSESEPNEVFPSQISTTVDSNARGRGGEITISANLLTVADGGFISSSSFGVGDSGGIKITIGSLDILQGSQIQSRITGEGASGGIAIRAEESVLLDGRETNDDIGFPSAITTGLGQDAEGRGGNINIAAGSLSLTNRAQILSNTEGVGSAGNVSIEVERGVLLQNSDIITEVTEESGNGQGGDIQILASSLKLIDGSSLLADTENVGNAGNINIEVRNAVVLRGEGPGANDPDEIFPSQISTTVDQDARGRSGEITISGDSLAVKDGGFISSSTFGDGRAGNIGLAVDSISLQTGAELAARTFGEKDGGNLSLYTDRLRITDGSLVSTETSGVGNAGSLTVVATEAISLEGTTPDGSVRSNLNAITNAGGRGGDLLISAPYLTITDGAGVGVATFGSGDAGSLTIQNAELIEIIGSSNAETPSWLDAQTGENSTGQGGSIEVQSDTLRIADDALITARSSGTGTAGEVTLNIADTLHLSDGGITTEALKSSGGNITINSDDESASSSGVLVLEGDSDITTESSGNGGNVTIRMPVVAFDDSDILARSQSANGGNITLSALFSDTSSFKNLLPFDGNDKVDINADGDLASGSIAISDTSFIQNELAELSDNLVDVDRLVLSSCVVREQESRGTIAVSGSESLQTHPGNTSATYSTGDIRAIGENSSESRLRQPAIAIVEPQSVYSLPDGRLVMSRPC